MTLTELLISSAMIGVIITGALSADYAIRTWQKRIEKRTFTQQNLVIAIEKIMKHGQTATGTGLHKGSYSIDHGVSYGTDSSVPINFICFKQDPDQIPDNGDEYLESFIYSPTEFSDYPEYIKHCYCDSSSCNIDCDHDFFYATNPLTFFEVNPAGVDPDNGEFAESITIHLETRIDPEEAEHPLDNPAFSLETSFYPSGVSQ